MGLHNLTTDEWAESISPTAAFEETSSQPDDEDPGEMLSEEDQRI